MAHGCGTFGGLAPAGATPRQPDWKAAGAANTGFIFIRLLLLLCEGAKGNKNPRATFHALKLRMVILPVGVGMCIKILAVDTTTGIEFYMRVEHGVKIIIHGYPLGIRNTIIIT